MAWSPDDEAYNSYWEKFKQKKSAWKLAILIPIILLATFYLDGMLGTKVVIIDINNIQRDSLEINLEGNVTRTIIFYVKNIGRYNAFFTINWEPNIVEIEYDNFLFRNEIEYFEKEIYSQENTTLKITVTARKA